MRGMVEWWKPRWEQHLSLPAEMVQLTFFAHPFHPPQSSEIRPHTYSSIMSMLLTFNLLFCVHKSTESETALLPPPTPSQHGCVLRCAQLLLGMSKYIQAQASKVKVGILLQNVKNGEEKS